jgi:hypothetical protein
MLSLSKFAKNYDIFENLFSDEKNKYDYETVLNFFKLWEKKDLDKFMKSTRYMEDMKGLIVNIGRTKEINYNKAILAKDVYLHMMHDQFYCSMLYMLGRDKTWLQSKISMDSESIKNMEEIKRSEYASTILSMHYGPYRACPMFLQLFDKDFLVPHTENEYSDVFVKNKVIPSQIELSLIDNGLIQKLDQSYAQNRSVFLLSDYSVSPRKSERTATLFGNKIHAPSGGIRVAQKNQSSTYLMRMKSKEICQFDVEIRKVIDKKDWDKDSNPSQLDTVVDNCFKWFTHVVETDPVPWQGWHRYNHILSETEK